MADDFNVDQFMQNRRKAPTPEVKSDFNVDQFMQGRSGGAKVAQPAADFNVDQFMQGREQQPARQAPPQQAPPRPSAWENVKTGAKQGWLDYIEAPIYSLAEAGQEALKGNFQPAKQLAELAGRGVIRGTSLVGSAPNLPQYFAQDAKIAEVKREQNRRRVNDPAFVNQMIERSNLAEEAAKDPSLRGRATRFVSGAAVGAVPAVIAGSLSGGSLPAIAATTALQSAAEPENAVINAAMSAAPLPIGKAVGAVARRLRGAAPKPAPPSILTGAVEDMAAIRAAAQPVAESATPSLARRAGQIASDAYNLPRAVMASADVSAPLRQGAILTLPPSQWGRAAKAGVRMFQSFSSERFKRIAGEINSAPDAPIAKQSGLYLSTDRSGALRKAEEDFVSAFSERLPIVKQSNQAYSAYLDSLRMDTFAKYKRVIDRNDLLSAADKETAYRAAADWINVATGRGSLGKTLDKAMPAMGTIFFAPRYVASRINVLDPRTYLRNASTPAGRMVLKQQMSDLVQFAGMVSATYGLAKAAGAEVSLDPRSSDFLKMRFGNWRYDPLAGLQQVMRLFYRVGNDAQRAGRGLPAKQGETTLDVAGRFARSKLAPVPSYFVDMLARRDYAGRPFSPGKAALDRATPLIWNDFVEAMQKEGAGGAARTLPGLLGVGVQNFEHRSGDIKSTGNYAAKLQEHGIESDYAKAFKGEPEDLFSARRQRIEDWSDKYGNALVDHPAFNSLTPAQQKNALKKLQEDVRTEANDKYPNLGLFDPYRIIDQAKNSEREQAERNRRKIYAEP